MKKFLKHTYDDIGRIYHFDDGSQYYSVTTMLGATKDQSGLDKWRQRIGIEKAEQITKTAGNIGTELHECMESYLLNNEYQYPNNVVQSLARQIKPYCDKYIKHVYDTEKFMWSDKLQLAGTTDALVDYLMSARKTHFSILDFKTANQQPKIEWVKDYFIQMAIYGKMFGEMCGCTPPSKGVLLFAYKRVRSRNNQIITDLNKWDDDIEKRLEMFEAIR